MSGRVALIPMYEALRLDREIGITDAQASRGAFRMLAHNPGLAKRVYALLIEMVIAICYWILFIPGTAVR